MARKPRSAAIEATKRKLDKLERALGVVEEAVPEAITTLRDLAAESGPQDSVKLGAASKVIDLAMKLRDGHLKALEAAAAAEKRESDNALPIPKFNVQREGLAVVAGGKGAAE